MNGKTFKALKKIHDDPIKLNQDFASICPKKKSDKKKDKKNEIKV